MIYPATSNPQNQLYDFWDMKKGSSFEVDNGNGNNLGTIVDGAWYCCHTCWISIGQGPASVKVSRINWRRWWLDDGICKAKWHGEGKVCRASFILIRHPTRFDIIGRHCFPSCQNTSFISRANFSNSSASAKSSSWWIQVSHVTPFLQLKYCLREKVSIHKSRWSRTLLKKLGANKCRTATNKLKPPQT